MQKFIWQHPKFYDVFIFNTGVLQNSDSFRILGKSDFFKKKKSLFCFYQLKYISRENKSKRSFFVNKKHPKFWITNKKQHKYNWSFFFPSIWQKISFILILLALENRIMVLFSGNTTKVLLQIYGHVIAIWRHKSKLFIIFEIWGDSVSMFQSK